MTEKTTRRKVTIVLTPEQKQQIKQTMGLDVSALDLMPEELEERIAPTANLNLSKSNID
jgi:hypothetical protein